MSLKNECNKCKRVYTYSGDGSSNLCVTSNGHRDGHIFRDQDNYDLCPECTKVVNKFLGEFFDGN